MSSTFVPAPEQSSRPPSLPVQRTLFGASGRSLELPIIATLVAITLALAAWLYGDQPIRGDAQGYYDLAAQMARDGILSFESTFRTYGYPMFLTLLIHIVGPDPETVRSTGFFIQLALYIVAAWIGARRLGRALSVPAWTPWIYAITVCSPFILIHTVQMLTDVLSAILVYLAVVFSLPTAPVRSAEDTPAGSGGRAARNTVLLGMLTLFLAGLSVTIRPSNLVVVPVLIAAWLFRTFWFREIRWQVWPVLLVMLALPFVPQMVFNYRAYGVPNPLLMLDLYSNNSIHAMRTTKYATLSITGVPPRLYYENPFGPTENTTPLAYLREEPVKFVITLALHVFALFDQDFPFTYITDLTPWYRWPLSIPNYLYVPLGFAGLLVGLRWPGGQTAEERRRFRCTFGLLGAAIGMLVAIYLPVMVENRYSLPIYPLMAAPVLLAVWRLWAAVRQQPVRLALVGVVAMTWVAAMMATSLWVDRNAPALVEARAVMARPRPPSPSASYDLDLPEDWEPGKMVTIPIQVQNTGSDVWNVDGFFPVAVRAQFLALKTEQHKLLPKGARVYVAPDQAVPPGGTATVTARLETPTATGRYIMAITVIRHGIDETDPGFEEQVKVDKGR